MKVKETVRRQNPLFILRARKGQSLVSAQGQPVMVAQGGGRLTTWDGEAPLENGWVSFYPWPAWVGFREYWRILIGTVSTTKQYRTSWEYSREEICDPTRDGKRFEEGSN
jgi:hypothetical protein